MKHLLILTIFTILAILALLAVTVQGQTNNYVVTLQRTGKFNIQYTLNQVDQRTNVLSKLTTPTNWCDRIPASDHDQAVKDLAKGGVICRLFGHQWTQKIGDMVFSNTRLCNICGKNESKTEENWK